jgi:hypothetical protein
VSLARSYVTFQGVFLLVCGLLALRKTRRGTLGILGWLWLSYVVFLLSYNWLYVHRWAFLRDNGSYILFITAMVAILLSRPKQLPTHRP